MRINLRTTIVAALLALASVPAAAADLPLVGKNGIVGSAYPTGRCGLFYGLNAEGSGTSVSGAGVPNGTQALGGAVGGLIGYACPLAGIPFFLEADFDFQNLNAANAGFSLQGPAHFTQVFAIQTPILSWFSQLINVGQSQTLQPSQFLPLLPPGTTINGQPANYIGFTTTEDDISASIAGSPSSKTWMFAPGLRTGLLFNASNSNTGLKAVIDTYVGLDFMTQSVCFGAAATAGCATLRGTSGQPRVVVGLSVKM